MIHMYTVNELEEISGFTRRTIGDYVAKGLLAGPSHRGRGARYSQADVSLLQVIPRLRTLMKKELPSLREVHEFLRHLSAHDVHSCAFCARDIYATVGESAQPRRPILRHGDSLRLRIEQHVATSRESHAILCTVVRHGQVALIRSHHVTNTVYARKLSLCHGRRVRHQRQLGVGRG